MCHCCLGLGAIRRIEGVEEMMMDQPQRSTSCDFWHISDLSSFLDVRPAIILLERSKLQMQIVYISMPPSMSISTFYLLLL